MNTIEDEQYVNNRGDGSAKSFSGLVLIREMLSDGAGVDLVEVDG